MMCQKEADHGPRNKLPSKSEQAFVRKTCLNSLAFDLFSKEEASTVISSNPTTVMLSNKAVKLPRRITGSKPPSSVYTPVR